MKWVLNTYQTAQTWSVEETIAVCQATGHEGIEFLQDRDQAHGLEADAATEMILAIREKMQAAGLIVASLTSCCAFHHADAVERERSIAQVRRVIDQAVLLGCDQVRVLGDHFPEDDERERNRVLGDVAASLHTLGVYARPKGVTVSIEAHWSFTDPIYCVQVVREANLPNVGIVFNSQWRIGAETGWRLPPGATSIAPLYDLFAPYITSVHTHQMEDPGLRPYYQEFFRLLKRDGYRRCISNECAYIGPDTEKVLRLYTALFRAFTN
jgi:sugar phosphate isomerase/epimerase